MLGVSAFLLPIRVLFFRVLDVFSDEVQVLTIRVWSMGVGSSLHFW